MGNNDPISQEKFYDTMNGTKKEILEAVDKVNDSVQDNRVAIGKIETKLDTHETRMNGQDKKIEGQKNWNRGLAAVEAAMAAVLVALGIGKE